MSLSCYITDSQPYRSSLIQNTATTYYFVYGGTRQRLTNKQSLLGVRQLVDKNIYSLLGDNRSGILFEKVWG